MNDKNWSNFQQAVFNWVTNPNAENRALVVNALAGTGKTTTMVESINRAPETAILATAFNVKNAEDLQNRIVNPNAKAATFNSLGMGICVKYMGRLNVTKDLETGKRRVRQVAGTDCPEALVGLIAKLASKGKHMLPRGSIQTMVDIANEFDLVPAEEWVEEGWTVERCAELALKAMECARTARDGSIDYDDQVYLPVANRWIHPKYDLVIVDECQDTDPAQLRLAQGLCRKGGRFIVVGDRNQAIYAFRGADSKSMDRLKTELKATELTLPMTYRCGKKIVALAAELVPGYVAHESNGEGEILNMTNEKMAETAQVGDFVLSRKNAPLTGACLTFLKMGKRAKVEGKDIGRGLISMVRKLAGTSKKGISMPTLMERLAAWEKKETARVTAAAKTEEAAEVKVAEVADKAETVRVLAEGMASVNELVKRIEDLFEDKVGAGFITCMTVHKAKGRETDRVFLLEETFSTKSQEEKNIKYVAITRAKNTLVWVGGKKPEPAPTAAPGSILPSMEKAEENLAKTIANATEAFNKS